MALNQEITQKQQQTLTAQQIQQIKLLEIPALEMEERILQEIDINPALEFGKDPSGDDSYDEDFDNGNFDGDEDFDDNGFDNAEAGSSADNSAENTSAAADDERLDNDDEVREEQTEELSGQPETTAEERDDYDDYLSDYDDRAADYAETQPRDPNQESEDRDPFYRTSQVDTLQDFLKQQLSDLEITERQELIGEYIIGNIEEDGYLRVGIDTISDQLAFQASTDVSDDEIAEVLAMIKEFEPAGIAAKDLKECLLLQLYRKSRTKAVADAIYLLEHYFEQFSDRKNAYICQRWGISEEQLADAVKEITKLNPKPGNNWEATLLSDTGRQITPDFRVTNHNGKLELSLNDTTIPDLHISPSYIKMLREFQAIPRNKRSTSVREAANFARQKIDAANWFINAIAQRQNTLLRTMQAILDRQEAFFLSGEERKLRPMRLKDVAADTGLDISTISRVSTKKFVETEYGVFPLKFFFSESMSTTEGEEVSVREIQTALRELIDHEDKKHPLADEALVKLLNQQGYQVARRTVAKYRDQLGIPGSRQRGE